MTSKTTPSSYLILPLWILALVMMCAMLQEAANIFLWVACSFFLMALLDPASERLRKYVPRSLAALIAVATATILAVVFVYILVHFSAHMVADLENSRKMFFHYYRTLRTTWDGWMQVFALPGHGDAHALAQPMMHSSDATAAAGDAIANGAQASPTPVPTPAAVSAATSSGSGAPSFGGDIASTLARGLGSFFSVLIYAFLIPVLTFFMLTERDHFGRVIQKAMHKPEQGKAMWLRIVQATRAYFFGNLLLGILSFPILSGLFFIFKVPSPLTLAALASVFNLIPFLGSVLSGLLPAIALLSTGSHSGTVILLYALCAVFHMILANFVTPKVLGRQLNVNATTSTLALVIFGELCGGMGLILAIPFVAVIKIMLETSDLWWLQWIASLMSDRPGKAAVAATPPAV